MQAQAHLQKHIPEFRRDLIDGRYEVTDSGIALKRGSVLIRGHYFEGIQGKAESFRLHRNLLVTEGINHMLNVVLGTGTKVSAWYIAPFSGSAAPAANWTASNFASNATEITSTTEGFSETTRQQATFGTSSGGIINNYSSKAAFTINCSSSLNILGAGLLSSNTRGGTTGVLMSAVKFASARVLADGDVWNAGYQVDLTDS